jgi:hypothetical protein
MLFWKQIDATYKSRYCLCSATGSSFNAKSNPTHSEISLTVAWKEKSLDKNRVLRNRHGSVKKRWLHYPIGAHL